MVIKTRRLEIRYIESDDWKSLIEIWKDFNQSEYSRYDIPHSLDETEVREKTKRWAEVSPYKELAMPPKEYVPILTFISRMMVMSVDIAFIVNFMAWAMQKKVCGH